MKYVCESFSAEGGGSEELYDSVIYFFQNADFLNLPDTSGLKEYFHSPYGLAILTSGEEGGIEGVLDLETAFMEGANGILEKLLKEFPQFKSNDNREIVETGS